MYIYYIYILTFCQHFFFSRKKYQPKLLQQKRPSEYRRGAGFYLSSFLYRVPVMERVLLPGVRVQAPVDGSWE